MKTAILAILTFCIMIFPHELGHLVAAERRQGCASMSLHSAWGRQNLEKTEKRHSTVSDFFR